MENQNKKIYHVDDYGTLYEGANVTEEQKWSNTNAIQTALDTAGKDGGGTVVIPEGTYCLNANQGGPVPGIPGSTSAACLYICYGNIVLTGAGIDKTKLVTVSEFKVINKTVYRAHGIRIIPGDGEGIGAVAIKNLDLFGGTHATGNIHWPANIDDGDGWDLTHKGIAIMSGRVSDFELDHVCVHGYRGELIYVAGYLKTMTVSYCKTYDTNAQCFNGNSHDTRVYNCQFGDPSYTCNTWIEYANINWYPELGDASCSFRNCYFTNNRHNTISFNEGHNDNYRLLFENNVFDLHNGITRNGISCFVFDGGTSGPAVIRNNTFISRDGAISAFNTDCWEGRQWHKDENIIIENNRFYGFRALLSFVSAYGAPIPERMINNRYERLIKNITVRNNIFDSYKGEEPRPLAILGNDKEMMTDYLDTAIDTVCLAGFENVIIENNTFNDAVTPWLRDHYGSVPVFRNNKYNNPILKESKPASYSAIQPVSNEFNRVVPVFEFLKVKAETPVNARLRTGNPMELNVPDYADGYEVSITGEKGTAPVTFIPDRCNTWKEPITVTENNYILIRFNKELKKWVLAKLVDEPFSYDGDGADATMKIGADMTQHIGTDDTVIEDVDM